MKIRTFTLSSGKIKLQLFSDPVPFDEFDTEAHILVTLTMILHVVLELSREEI